MRQILFFAIAAMVHRRHHAARDEPGRQRTPTEAQPAKRAAARAAAADRSYRTVTVRGDSRGHFQVEGSVDGRRLDFMVDTGATVVALRERDAGKLGIFPTPRDYTGRSSTANGIIKVAPVRLPSLEVNGIRVYDVRAVVIPDEALVGEPARHVVPLARAALRDGQRPSRDGTISSLNAFNCVGACAMCSAPAFARPEDLMLPKPKAVADSQHLCLRIRADGEADRLSRIRRALAVRQRDQPDGRAGAGARPRHPDP